MITKNTITPWHQPQLQSFRSGYLENILGVENFIRAEGKSDQNVRKKMHSLNDFEPQPKTTIKKSIEFERFKTLVLKQKKQEEKEQIWRVVRGPKNKMLARQKKLWLLKQRSLQSIKNDDFAIFKSKSELTAEKSFMKLPKIQIKVCK